MYHEIAPQQDPRFAKYVLSPRRFAAHLRWLRLAGYRSITLATLLRARRDPGLLPPRPVLITFDDGFQACVQYAPEILQQHGFGAVFFLVSGLVGRTSRWLTETRGIERPLADWADARALLSAGFECGAHTATHPNLTRLSDGQVHAEIADARRSLQDRLGHDVVHLAYPFGAYDSRVRQAVADAGYQSACTVNAGLATQADDVLALPRVPIDGTDTIADFIWRVRTASSLREVYARWRARRAEAS
jgi:peptidoglycan/xylan/chitin deacetylase (PgdA/CDA1 family)